MAAIAALASKVGTFVTAMNTAPTAKAMAVAAAMRWLLGAFAPDMVALQEFNCSWLDEASFA